MRYSSPLRYPGGKAGLAGLLGDIISVNNLEGCAYYEPYAGGAGAALALLQGRIVSELYLNDLDIRIYYFWISVLKETDRFARRILEVPLTIEEWKHQHEICSNPQGHSSFDVGFSAFYMNRCNRSGVLTGAGPIGGYGQAGQWTIAVRFSREALAERVLALGRAREIIHVSNLDAIEFLKSKLPSTSGRGSVFAYLDPPYVQKGQRLYLNAYEQKDHAALARYMKAQKSLKWIISYDEDDLIKELYAGLRVATMPIHYTLQNKRKAQELIITPRHVYIPYGRRDGTTLRTLDYPDMEEALA